MKASEKHTQDTKWVFFRQGTCSRTMFHLLNHEFDHKYDEEERAVDPLAGGIMQEGYQCGMIWGAAMAVGAEAFHRNDNLDDAIASAIEGSREVLTSFANKAGSPDCGIITKTDFNSKRQIFKYMFTGKFIKCYKLADNWAPEAIEAAKAGLSTNHKESSKPVISCASEVLKKMGGTDEEMALVAGFAGGVGLTGNACGALAASVWKTTLDWNRKHPGKSVYFNPEAKKKVAEFKKATDGEFFCHKICGRHFTSVAEHAEFIKKGGCDKLIDLLAKS
jgi:C_GCAxxG_C_C family probable redox protein